MSKPPFATYRVFYKRRPHTRAERDLLPLRHANKVEYYFDNFPWWWFEQCRECGEYFRREGGFRYDSDECEHDARLRRERERRRIVREDRDCERCGKSFMPSRSDARFCSARCRVAAHRER